MFTAERNRYECTHTQCTGRHCRARPERARREPACWVRRWAALRRHVTRADHNNELRTGFSSFIENKGGV